MVEKLKDLLKRNLLSATIPRKRRIFTHVKKGSLKAAVSYLVKELKFKHLSTITGVDLGEEIEVIYHLAYRGSIVLSLKVAISKNSPNIPTITDLIPGAVLYEREVHDLLGVEFEGHPDLSPLMLPEGWPESVYPLRKKHKLERLRQIPSEVSRRREGN